MNNTKAEKTLKASVPHPVTVGWSETCYNPREREILKLKNISVVFILIFICWGKCYHILSRSFSTRGEFKILVKKSIINHTNKTGQKLKTTTTKRKKTDVTGPIIVCGLYGVEVFFFFKCRFHIMPKKNIGTVAHKTLGFTKKINKIDGNLQTHACTKLSVS